MSRKLKVIEVQDDTDRSFYVWTDLSVDEIERVEGVTQASKILGDIHVYIDPRYDMHSIKAEIIGMAYMKAGL